MLVGFWCLIGVLSLIRNKQFRHKVWAQNSCKCIFSFWTFCQTQTWSACSLRLISVQCDECVALKNTLSWKIHASPRRGISYCGWQRINVSTKSTSESCPILMNLTSVCSMKPEALVSGHLHSQIFCHHMKQHSPLTVSEVYLWLFHKIHLKFSNTTGTNSMSSA